MLPGHVFISYHDTKDFDLRQSGGIRVTDFARNKNFVRATSKVSIQCQRVQDRTLYNNIDGKNIASLNPLRDDTASVN